MRPSYGSRNSPTLGRDEAASSLISPDSGNQPHTDNVNRFGMFPVTPFRAPSGPRPI